MAREKMVTRTITKVNYNVMVVNTKENTVSEKIVVLPDSGLIGDKLNKAVAANLPEPFAFVMIKAEEKQEELYGMSETKFLKCAMKLDKR